MTLDVNPTGGYLLGLSLRVFQQTVTLTDRKNQRFDQIELKSKHLADPDAVIRAVAAAMGTMVEKCRNREWSLAGGGIAITGAIEPGSGTVSYARCSIDVTSSWAEWHILKPIRVVSGGNVGGMG